MKYVLIFSALVMLAAAETYSPDNDDLDIEQVVGNVDTLRTFIKCFNDNGECNEVTTDFKKDIPEAFQQACLKCTEAQKHMFKRFLEVAKEKLPVEYGVFLQKYDPKGEYLEPLRTAIASF